MTLREFIDFSIIRLAPLYPEAEAKAIAFRLLDYYLEIPSYKYISDPDLPIVPDDRPEQAEAAPARRVERREDKIPSGAFGPPNSKRSAAWTFDRFLFCIRERARHAGN